MAWQKVIMDFISRHRNIFFLTIFFILFQSFFIPIYQKYIVDKFLIFANRSTFVDILFLLLLIFCGIWIYKKIKHSFFFQIEHLIYPIVSATVYTVIRYYYFDSLTSFKNFETLKYFDFVYIFSLIPFLLLFAFPKDTIRNEGKKLFDDREIENADDDILDRNPKAIQVATLLKNNKSKNSIAIGIVGKWGDGKSSFMNLIEACFNDDDAYILVHFKSWLNISSQSIIQDFFNTVEKEISPLSFDVSKELRKYGKNVLSINQNSTTETILNAINLLPDNSLSDDFDKINTLLNKLNKRVIVFFDDVDRLQPHEVFEVLKLIRNTASFDVFSFVVGYDKKYIIKALKNNKIPNPDKYCEKIFLQEFPLSPITQKEINKFLKTKMIDLLPSKVNEIESSFDNIKIYLDSDHSNVFSSISNLRNAKRYLNEFMVIVDIEDEVAVKDFMLIKLLKFSYYDIYKFLFNKDKFIDNRNNGDYNGNITFNDLRLKQKAGAQNSVLNFSGGFKNSILKEEIDKLEIYNPLEVETIGRICGLIFNDEYIFKKTTSLSLSYGKNYYKYFNDDIESSTILKSEFDIFLTADFRQKTAFIDDLKEENRLSALMLFIYKVDILVDLNSKSNYEDFIKVLFYIADTSLRNTIDETFLYGITDNYRDSIVQKFGYDDESELKSFLQSIFYEEKEYYDFKPNYLKFIISRHSSVILPFTNEEVINYLIFCFNKNCLQIKSIDSAFWDCYRLCFIKEWKNVDSNIIGSTNTIEANREKFLYEVLPKYLDLFLVYITTPQDYYAEASDSYKIGIPRSSAINVIGSIQEFIKYLESPKLNDKLTLYPSEFLKEFLTFILEFESANSFIDFSFEYTPMLEKLDSLAKKTWH